MVGSELVFLVGRSEGKEEYENRHFGPESGKEGSDRSVAAAGVASWGRLRDIGSGKSPRYFALVEAYSRRETLMKGGHQPFYHRMMIVVLSPRAWGK